MVFFPPCKINIGLHVVGKRADGYHELVTCFYPVPWHDMLEVIPSRVFSFTHSGLPVAGNVSDNLCLKAYHLLRSDFDLPAASIHLHKIIPMGAGLGGGSSDAAWTLRALNQTFNLDLKNDQLEKYAAQLGSDCAFFIHDKPMLGTGRGETLKEINADLKGKFIVLVKPEIHVSTAEAYAGVNPGPPEKDLKIMLEQHPIEQWKDLVKNDFEESVFKKHPVISKIKSALYASGALYASMSGSGSAVFGIFSRPVDLQSTFRDHIFFAAVV